MNEIEQLRTSKSSLQSDLDNARKKSDEAETESDQRLRELAAVKKQLDDLKIDHDLSMQRKESTIDELKKEIANGIISSDQSIQLQLIACKEEIDSLSNERERLQKRLADEELKNVGRAKELETYKKLSEDASGEYRALLTNKEEETSKSLEDRDQEIQSLMKTLEEERRSHRDVATRLEGAEKHELTLQRDKADLA